MFCTHCGKKNPDGANFCFSCGAVLPAESAVGVESISVVAAKPEGVPDPEVTNSSASRLPTVSPHSVMRRLGTITAPSSTEALSERDVAKLLKLSRSTLRKWRRQGMGPRYFRLGRSIRYFRPDVQAFVESGERE
jgi:predicted DNA-binding transcriptional regulator AlpA